MWLPNLVAVERVTNNITSTIANSKPSLDLMALKGARVNSLELMVNG